MNARALFTIALAGMLIGAAMPAGAQTAPAERPAPAERSAPAERPAPAERSAPAERASAERLSPSNERTTPSSRGDDGRVERGTFERTPFDRSSGAASSGARVERTPGGNAFVRDTSLMPFTAAANRVGYTPGGFAEKLHKEQLRDLANENNAVGQMYDQPESACAGIYSRSFLALQLGHPARRYSCRRTY
jgi:hypothetical protein